MKPGESGKRAGEDATGPVATNIGVGWDMVLRVGLAGVGISIVNSRPSEIAYITFRGLQLQYGLSTWESFINVSVCVFALASWVFRFPQFPLLLWETRRTLLLRAVMQTGFATRPLCIPPPPPPPPPPAPAV